MTVAVRTRTLAAGVALVLPLAAVAGCNAAVTAKKETIRVSLEKAAANLAGSRSASFVVRFDDPRGTLRKAAPADLLNGGTVSFTIDPTGNKTLRDLQNADPKMPAAEKLNLANIELTVDADGGPVSQIRLVNGTVYVRADINRVSRLARKAGTGTDPAAALDAFGGPNKARLKPLITDIRSGRWIRLPLAPYAGLLDGLAAQNKTGTPPVDGQKLGADLIAAVQPYITVTDAAVTGTDRILDVKVQAKPALKAVLDQLRSLDLALPGKDQPDTTAVDRLKDGTVDGQVVLTGDHLRRFSFDLGSVARLVPAGKPRVPDLTGAAVVVDVNDAAAEVKAPTDVSPVDVGALLTSAVSDAAF